jgi:hypothetical protein
MDRNYAGAEVRATLKSRLSAVIASEAKQSTPFYAEGWIASSLALLAMTKRSDGLSFPSPAERWGGIKGGGCLSERR